MLKYPSRAIGALELLKRKPNGFTVFVEDTRGYHMWSWIVRKSVGDDARRATITMLGGRDAVLAACREYVKTQPDGRAVFLIDGDFDFLLGRRKPPLKKLYRVPSYCIEGLLVAKGPVESVAAISLNHLLPADIEARVNFSEWESRNVRALLPVFVVYAIAKQLAPSIPTVGAGVQPFLIQSSNRAEVCRRKVFIRSVRLAREVCRVVGYAAFFSAIHQVRNRLSTLSLRQAISGKMAHLPLLRLHLAAMAGLRASHDELRVLLAAHWESSLDRGLVKRLKNLL
jgi:hypothetical protein